MPLLPEPGSLGDHQLDDLALTVITWVITRALVVSGFLLMGGAHRLMVQGGVLPGVIVAAAAVGLCVLALWLSAEVDD